MISLHLDPLLLLIWHPSMCAKQREGERKGREKERERCEREELRGNKKGKIESESKEKVRNERKLKSGNERVKDRQGEGQRVGMK